MGQYTGSRTLSTVANNWTSFPLRFCVQFHTGRSNLFSNIFCLHRTPIRFARASAKQPVAASMTSPIIGHLFPSVSVFSFTPGALPCFLTFFASTSNLPISTSMANVYNRAPDWKSSASSARPNVSRKDFPSGFNFGVATSAYQVEGAALDGGRGMSIWDSFSHLAGNIVDRSTGDVTTDHYHQYLTDVQLMVDLGIDSYRFSISWSRIFPAGAGEINQEGVTFYNKLINHLLHNGIEPYVTLYHWDMPQALENDPNIKGWRTREIVKQFAHYAETCFKLFGDRVKNWTTLNEPWGVAYHGYGVGTKSPGRCSAICGTIKRIYVGDSGTEPYLCAHHALLSHAAAVKLYKTKYEFEQRGKIGISVNSRWYEPYTNTKEDTEAAQRCLEFNLGWFLDPILLGDYPESMRVGAGSRLPGFSEDERRDLLGSLDFVGYNYYTACYAKSTEPVKTSEGWYDTDKMAEIKYADPEGRWIGEPYGPVALRWIYNCPWALPKMLQWMEDRYGRDQFCRTPILITENGTTDKKIDLPLEEAVKDSWRVQYLNDTLSHFATALREKNYNVKAYFIWSLIDNFEWDKGLIFRFGLYYVDYKDQQKRYPKMSALWYHTILKDDASNDATRYLSHNASKYDSQHCNELKRKSRGCIGLTVSDPRHFVKRFIDGLLPSISRCSFIQTFIMQVVDEKKKLLS